MQSHLSFQLMSIMVKLFLSGQYSHLTSIPLNWASAKLCTLSEGRMLIQSLSNYLVHLEVVEFTISREVVFNIIVRKPSFFMFVMFKGKSFFSDLRGNVISESTGNSGTICYLKAGSYNWRFSAGQHAFLCLTFRTAYFLREYKNMPEFKPLIAASLSPAVPYAVLPNCLVAKSILNYIKRLLVKNTGHLKKNAAIDTIVDEFVNKYRKSLLARQYDTHTYNQLKTAEISAFIQQHFDQNDSYNVKLLASRFNVSQRNLMRLVKTAFGMSLRDYVVKLRMNRAFTELLNSKRSVKAVAVEVGYPDAFHFSRLFKKHYGIAPSEVKGPAV